VSGQKPSYKPTLHLPDTAFSMRAGLAKKEPQILERWQEQNLYERIQEARSDAPPFMLHDGPPYANGHIHHGHILNKVLKDFVVKQQTMNGRRAPYVPGWDCHGLPIEHKVDEELGKKKREMSQVEIRRACREYAARFVAIQREEFERLGVLGQWDDPYLTMDYEYEARTVRLLGEFLEAGVVIKGLKPIHWSWAAQTALAEAEVEYDEHVSPSIYVKFPFPAAPAFLADAAEGLPVNVVIWTTTPWTLPANLAIALHPDFDYELLAVGDSALIVAQGLKARTLAECKIDAESVRVLASFKGAQLVGTGVGDAPRHAARHPFLDRDSVLLPADYVTLEQGTGCVHTAPGHGQEDFQLGREFGLDVLNPVNRFGKYTAEFEEMKGVHVFKANPVIVEKLVELGVLLSHPKLSVKIERYPHCWRTKTPVIFRATEQWFIGLDVPMVARGGKTLRELALEEIERVDWVPSWGRDRIHGMMVNRPDWCISRQRLWGVPITVFFCNACEGDIVTHEVAYHVAKLAEEHGSDIWFDWGPERLVPEGFCCPSCGADATQFRKEGDILDVWFDSGSSWSAVLNAKLGLESDTADLYLEGSDQHRGWFNSSMLIGLGSKGSAPYDVCLTHGFVVDDTGRKYSKSSKNFVKPQKMIDVDGVDVLRLWVAAVDYRADITLSAEILKTVKDAYRKLRNTCRFLLGTLSDFDPAVHAQPLEAMDDLDRWALARTTSVMKKVGAAYARYEFHSIYHLLIRYATVDLSNTYLNALKDRLYCAHRDDVSRRASQTAVFGVLQAFVRMMAPILAFTADEVWEHMPHAAGDPDNVHMAHFLDVDPAWTDLVATWPNAELEERWEQLRGVQTEVQRHVDALRPKKRGERAPGQIGSTEEAVVTLVSEGATLDLLRKFGGQLPEYFIVSQVNVEEGTPAETTLEGQRAAEVEVRIVPSDEAKCPRCWRYGRGVGSVLKFPDLCTRCGTVLAAGGGAS
jgi:isoleucyl-tRNA synthetase